MLDALEQALYDRTGTQDLVHHSDRGSQYLSIRYAERLAEADISPSVGSVGDSYARIIARKCPPYPGHSNSHKRVSGIPGAVHPS